MLKFTDEVNSHQGTLKSMLFWQSGEFVLEYLETLWDLQMEMKQDLKQGTIKEFSSCSARSNKGFKISR
ncbi:hypothetical protein VBZ67_11560 [Campylobacter concisus]